VGCGVKGFISEGSSKPVHLYWHTATCSLQKTAVQLQLRHTWLNRDNSLPDSITSCTPIICKYNALIAPILEVCHLGTRRWHSVWNMTWMVIFYGQHKMREIRIMMAAPTGQNWHLLERILWVGFIFCWKPKQAGQQQWSTALYILFGLCNVCGKGKAWQVDHARRQEKSSLWTKWQEWCPVIFFILLHHESHLCSHIFYTFNY